MRSVVPFPRLLGLIVLLAAAGPAVAGPVTIFSASPDYRTPETISPAPASFGTYGGQYFIPDFNRAVPDGQLWVVPEAGGPPTSFATIPVINARGGLFLPDAGWGAHSGHFLAAGPVYVGGVESGRSQLVAFAPDGTAGVFLEADGSFAQARIAPDGFGAFAGQLVIANAGFGNVLAVSAAGVVSAVAATPIRPFGLAFAPDGFGAFGGQAFASSAADGRVVAIAADGTVTPFADIPLMPGQTSLFQIEFSPAGFIPGYDELMFVSVRGSLTGGGTLGDVVVLDAEGNIVTRLRSDLGLEKFDPRGMYFIDNRNLLISDASDPILLVTPAAFQSVPAPPAAGLFALGLAALGVRRLARRAAA
jgi:hypothetical protein